MILPGNVYKDIKADPCLAPTLPAELVRNDISEEQQKLLADLEDQRDQLEKGLTGLERDRAELNRSDRDPTGGFANMIRTSIYLLKHGIEATTVVTEKIKADANPNASAT